MAKSSPKPFTIKYLESLKPTASRQELPDGGLPGLYLIVQPSGAMSWAVRYRYGNRPRKMTIGPYPTFGLTHARDAGRAAFRAVAEGRDPGAEKLSSEASRSNADNLVTSVLDDFIKRHVKKKNRDSTAKETERFIDNELRPKWKHRHIKSITKRDVVELLDGIVDRGAPASANRVLAILRRFFNWAMERDIVETSPVAGVAAPGAVVTRDRVLSHDEIRLVWLAAETIGWPFGPMVKLLLLTGQRREEVASAEWSEFNFKSEQPSWTIPKERAKNNQGHFVPLSAAAVAVLKALPTIDGDKRFILTTTGETPVSGFSRAKAQLDAAMVAAAKREAMESGDDPERATLSPWRIHDLRRTCASGMASLGQPVHVVEAVLNHKSGQISGVAAVYNRHDYAEEKRRALSAWASFVQDIVRNQDHSNVVAFAR